MVKFRLTKAIVCSLVILSLQTLPYPSAAEAPTSTLPSTLMVLGRVLVLRDQQGGGPGQPATAEYSPRDEPTNHWTMMFAIHYAPGNLDPKASAQTTAQRVKARKEKGVDPLANVFVYEAKDGSVDVDFLASTVNPQLLEHNVWRYFKAEGGVGSYQLAMRCWGNATNQPRVAQFIRDIPTLRPRFFKELGRADLPKWP